jgi:hypothetical protein
VPRPWLAFTVNADQPRATINAVWLSLLPGPAGGGGGDDDGPRGWAAVVAAWVPRLMPALRTALFHGPSGPPMPCGSLTRSTHRCGAASWPGRWVTGRPVTARGSRLARCPRRGRADSDGAGRGGRRPPLPGPARHRPSARVSGAMAVEILAANIPASPPGTSWPGRRTQPGPAPGQARRGLPTRVRGNRRSRLRRQCSLEHYLAAPQMWWHKADGCRSGPPGPGGCARIPPRLAQSPQAEPRGPG